jgi:chaperonin GroEL
MITKGKQAKEKLLEGINETVDTAKISLGAKGKTVVIGNKYGLGFNVTKDGVSIIREIQFDDDLKSIGSDFVKNACNKTVDEAGDGTTSTSILVQSMCNNMYKELQLGKNPNQITADLKEDLSTVNEYIQNHSKKILNTEEIKNIAKVSANNDDEIGSLIQSIYDRAGMSVAIDIADSDELTTNFEIVNGFTMKDTGFSSRQFINNTEKGRVEFNNPRIFLYNNKVKFMTAELMALFEANADRNAEDFRPLVIIVEDIEEAPLREIVMAVNQQLIFNVSVVQSNLIYEDRKNAFIDASVFLNGDYNEDRIGNYGECEKIIIERDSVTFINGAGKTEKHIEKLKKSQKKVKDISLERRIFALESTAAIIKVGGKLGTEIDEKKDRIEDSVCAVRSALEEGYCPGGSTVYLFAKLECDLKTDIMKNALTSCYVQLMSNANLEPFYFLRDIEDKGFGFGYNLIKDEITDFYNDGIYDSAKVLRVSLENAVHTACNFALVEAIITSK